jgi:hypothetical protein
MGDVETHQKPATRFGVSITHARDDRYNRVDQPSPVITQVKLSDAVLIHETGFSVTDILLRASMDATTNT